MFPPEPRTYLESASSMYGGVEKNTARQLQNKLNGSPTVVVFACQDLPSGIRSASTS